MMFLFNIEVWRCVWSTDDARAEPALTRSGPSPSSAINNLLRTLLLRRLQLDNFPLNNTVVMGRVIRNQRKGRGSIFTANTRLNKAPAQFRTLDYVRSAARTHREIGHTGTEG
jgi:hypothetical protein